MIQTNARSFAPKQRFLYWVREREKIRLARAEGDPAPWSKDPIFQAYTFCNVNREHDRVTQWIRYNVRDRFAHYDTTFQVVQIITARIFNDPPILQRILPLTDHRIASLQVKQARADGIRIMRGAYMMPTHGPGMKGVKIEDYYLRVIPEAQKTPWDHCQTLQNVCDRLLTFHGVGPFVANQMVTDCRYIPKWAEAPDWETFLLCGPGTTRGLNRYDGLPPDTRRKQAELVARLLEIREELQGYISDEVREAFRDPNNLSNCMCEFDKYERALFYPRARLVPGLRRFSHGIQST